MGDATEHEGAHADVDHGLRHVEAPFVVPHKAAPADHPAEGTLHTQRRGRT